MILKSRTKKSLSKSKETHGWKRCGKSRIFYQRIVIVQHSGKSTVLVGFSSEQNWTIFIFTRNTTKSFLMLIFCCCDKENLPFSDSPPLTLWIACIPEFPNSLLEFTYNFKTRFGQVFSSSKEWLVWLLYLFVWPRLMPELIIQHLVSMY